MENITIISNTCVGQLIFASLKLQYNNPFISYLFQIDDHFIKLCENLRHYVNVTPIVDYNPSLDSIFAQQNQGPYYRHSIVKVPYPIIHLDDIEIHAIHETSIQLTLDKFQRRMARLKKLLDQPDHKIFYCFSYSEFINHHENYSEYIQKFLSNQNEKNIKFFLGPTQLYTDQYTGYIIENSFDQKAMTRCNCVLTFNNQLFNRDKFITQINKHLNSNQSK